MIQEDIEEELREAQEHDGFLYPAYDSFCIANLAPTVWSLFDIETDRRTIPERAFTDVDTDREKIIVFLVDGLGYMHWKEYRDDYPLLDRLSEKGTVTPMTAMFPSTTAATLTTINTGLTPQEHGIPEWTVYMDEIGGVIQTLPMTTLEGMPIELEEGERLFTGRPMYEKLADHDIPSYVFQSEQIAGSQYSEAALTGSEVIPYGNLAEMAVSLRKKVEETEGKAYFYVYISDVDTMAHEYGPRSAEHRAQLAHISHVLGELFLDEVDGETAEETLVLMSADHGQVKVTPEETTYLNEIEGLEEHFKESRHGFRIPPTGSPRDVFLHIEDGEVAAVEDLLAEELGDDAAIRRMDDVLEDGLFGRGEVEERFRDRIGDLLILPRDGNTVWFEHMPGERFDLEGHHGGMTPEEMLVPFLAAELDALI